MTEKKEDATDTRRTQVKDLPKSEKELSKNEQKKIKGGGWLMTPSGNARPNGT